MSQKRRLKFRNKVLVAMSGGVDSSVAAALLKRTGFDVTGAFMRLNDFSKESEKRAKKVAGVLKIPFYVFNFEKEFKKKIVDYFLKEHEAGLTPNPCVVCNKTIKFGVLLDRALSLGIDYIATGHYAKKIQNPKSKIQKLLMAKDKEKDQSYFLWKLDQEQLGHVIFPVGNYTRARVEKLAEEFKLPFSNVQKSMEICFVPKSTADFLKKYLKTKPGGIVDRKKKVVGRHEGLQIYTIGQRKGIGLPGGPFYVLNKDFKKNLLIVTKNEKDLYKKELVLKNVNWISGKEPKLPLRVKVKIRYRSEPVSTVINKNLKTRTYTLKFAKPQRAITPGQSAVFYRREEPLGGGIIC